jgi:hypothetical protein
MNGSAEDMSSVLVLSSSALNLIEGTDLFISREPDSPNAVVTIYDTGGGEPSSGTENNEFPTIQVRVRGAVMDYEGAYDLIASIKDIIHNLASQTINNTKYIGVWASSDIIPLGYDTNDRPILTINFRIHRTA